MDLSVFSTNQHLVNSITATLTIWTIIILIISIVSDLWSKELHRYYTEHQLHWYFGLQIMVVIINLMTIVMIQYRFNLQHLPLHHLELIEQIANQLPMTIILFSLFWYGLCYYNLITNIRRLEK